MPFAAPLLVLALARTQATGRHVSEAERVPAVERMRLRALVAGDSVEEDATTPS
jgi:hypothetical protein